MRQKLINYKPNNYILVVTETDDNDSLIGDKLPYINLARYLNVGSPEFIVGILGIHLTENDDIVSKIKELNSTNDVKRLDIFRIQDKKPKVYNAEIVKSIIDWDGETVSKEIEDVFIHLSNPFSYLDTTKYRTVNCAETLISDEAEHYLSIDMTEDNNTIFSILENHNLIIKKSEHFLPRNVVIAGSRVYENDSQYANKYNNMFNIMEKMIKDLKLDPTKDAILSGTAEGADKIGEMIAASLKIPVKRYPADWKKFGKAAGYKRNYTMGVLATEALIFWDGKSKGSKMMGDIMLSLKKPFKIININPKVG